MSFSPVAYPASQYFHSVDFPLTVQDPQTHEHARMHSHAFTELVVIQSGQVVHVMEEEKYTVEAGDVFVIHEGDNHGYCEGNNLILWNVLYDSPRMLGPAETVRKLPGYHALFCIEPRLRKRFGKRAYLRLHSHDLDKALSLISDIQAELSRREAGYELVATALFMQLVGLLSRRYSRHATAPPSGLLRIGNVIGFIEENYGRPVTLKQLAEIANLSPRQILRTFREATGRSPIEYLLQRRIAKAMDLLRTRDMNITEVSFAVGFTDSNYFSRQFRRITGQSPRQFRQEKP